MSDVTFSGVSKRYGAVSVIEGLDLHVEDHELMVLVGPSGCGKSTALRMIAGLEELTEGTISIGGNVVNNLPPKDRDIAMVFQSYALYPHMTVRENLAFGLKMRHASKTEVDRRVAETSEVLGVVSLLDRKPKDLSGGQRQRVALGRAIVRQPAVFLFDEPLSNLDAKLRVQMRAEITRLQQSLGTTAVYVTHDQVEAMTMGNRIAVMRGGKLQQLGTPIEVYERPANSFVAQFIGTPPMNLIPAVVSNGTLKGADFTLPLPERFRGLVREEQKVVAGIRPQNVGVGPRSTAADPAVVPAEVEVLEPIGHESIVYAKAGNERMVSIVGPQMTARHGDPIDMKIDLDALHLFDAESEARIDPKK